MKITIQYKQILRAKKDYGMEKLKTANLLEKVCLSKKIKNMEKSHLKGLAMNKAG